MGIMRKFLCWELRTASYIGFYVVVVTAFFAVILRALDLAAFDDDSFEISQGFHSLWKSHQWQAFLASDIVLIALHIIFIFFSVYMAFQVKRQHSILYINLLRRYTYAFMIYVFIEFCFSVFEFSFYGKNSFRLAFVVFIWLYWLIKSVIYIIFMIVLYARFEEMEDKIAEERRFLYVEKHKHSYERT
ncbi:uncharacterized protein LOC121374858 [Gigantopelta aegis]|uniref:uncharacterized protein LOC121374858 n=1 Tax=Gigantopelta aegis TaxID=1735272 RepID=UPI001B88AEB5|nr:uncharacterized protein LOC121374858 [Gigantopelta aegis]